MAAPRFPPGNDGAALAAAAPRQLRLHHQARLAGLFLAITGCFLVYSLIQERLMTLGFGPERERFRHSLFIILVNRLVTCAVAAAALGLAGKSLQPGAPLALFCVPSLANVLGSASQYEALKYVSFPLQALAKCAKTVPVMAWGLLLGSRKYAASDYLCAGTVTAGCAMFVLTGSIAAPQQHYVTRGAAALTVAANGATQGSGVFAVPADGDANGSVDGWMLYGLLLLGAFLLFDGLTSTTQDKLFAQYDMHSCSQLLWVSAWSAAISLGLLLASNQLLPALLFVRRHPLALFYILLLSMVSTAVQLFIFYTIQQYGALHFALIMTIRQFLSIVLSCLVFSHSLSSSQWFGTLLVIGGLVARGMHRGGLSRNTIKVAVTPSLRRAGSVGAAPGAAPRLPLDILVIKQLSMQSASGGTLPGTMSLPERLAAGLAAAKKYGEGIPLDVQAGALANAAADGTAREVQRGSPHSNKPNAFATRRKPADMA